MRVAMIHPMAKAVRVSTLRGLGPNPDELTDEDIMEVDGESPPMSRVSMTCIATVRADDEPPSLPLAIIPRRMRMFSGVFNFDDE